MNVIERTSAQSGVELIRSGSLNVEVGRESLSGTTLLYDGVKLNLKLLGGHQVENAKTALAAVEQLRKTIDISDKNIADGFDITSNPARFELLSRSPDVILDGAHNPDGISALKDAYKKYFKDKKAALILGMLADKDSKSSLKILEGLFETVYTVPVDNPRTLSAEALAEECGEYFDSVEAFGSVFEAFDKAYGICSKNGKALVIAGSLYLASQIRPYIFNTIFK